MSRRRRRRQGAPRSVVALGSCLSVFIAFVAPALGNETVSLERPTNTSEATRKCLARIRDELSADRFRVVWANSDTTREPGAGTESTATLAEPDTTVMLLGDPGTGQAELCVTRRAKGRAITRRATVVVDEPDKMPEVLASRALELLRATALEFSLAVERAPPTNTYLTQPPRESSPLRPFPSARTTNASRVFVDMGLGLWKSVKGPPPAVTPIGRLGLRLSESSQMRLSIAGLGSRPLVQSEYGTATVSQTTALLEFALSPGLDQRLYPLLSLGGGILHVAVAGSGVEPYEGLSARQWSALFDAGGGIAVAIGSRFFLGSEVHAFVASPHPVVRFVDKAEAVIAAPGVVFSLSLRAAL